RNGRSDDWPPGLGRKDGRLQIEARAGIQGARNLLVQHGDRAVLGWFIAPVTHDMDSPRDGEWAISEPGVADATRTQDYLSQAGTAWSQLRLDQPLANRVEHGLRAIVDLQLFVHVAYVVANGFLADVEPARDLLVRLAGGQQLEDLDLPGGQAVVELLRARGPGQHVEHPVRHRVRHHALTVDHGQDARDDGVRLW